MSASRVVWARYQGLVDFIGFHPLDKAIRAKIWLIISCDFLIPNFMKLFQCSRELDTKVMHMREVCLTLFLHELNKGPYVSNCAWPKFKLELHHVDLILTPSLPLDMSCLSSNPLLNWWQTPGVLHTPYPNLCHDFWCSCWSIFWPPGQHEPFITFVHECK